MKNQYVGDIGDFGKYSMLRAFVDAGVKVGVNWYLTENDGSNDGKLTDYLNKGKMRRYCPEIFDALIDIADKKDKSVTDIEESGILPGVRFYSDILKPDGTPGDREQERSCWFQESMHQSGITTNALAKLGKNEHVSTQILEKICRVLDCNIEDVCEFVNDEEGAEK